MEYDGDMNDVKREVWQQWRVPLAEFNDVNLANVARMAIGFGDRKPGGVNGYGIMYFDEIRLFSGVSEEPIVFPGDVVLTEDPFVYGYYDYPLFLKQDCNLIDAGYKYVDETRLAGRSTDVEWPPDSNMVDIGFHYLNWSYVGTGGIRRKADFNGDFMVDYNDLAFLVDYWLFDYGQANEQANGVWWWDCDGDRRIDYKDLAIVLSYWPYYFRPVDYADFARYWMCEVDERLYDDRPDLNKDGYVNFEDFAILASQWYPPQAEEPNVLIQISGDPNNLANNISICVTGCGATTERVFVLMDGGYVGEIVDVNDGEGGIGLDSRAYGNGEHSIKAVAVSVDGIVTTSENVTVNFDNEISYLIGGGSYKEGQDYHIYGMCSSENSLRVKVVDWDDTVVWTSPTISGNINLTIPESVFDGQIYDLVIEKESGVYAMMAESGEESWERIWARSISKVYEPSISYRFAIFIPSVWGFAFPDPIPFNSANTRKKTVAEIVRACETKNMPYVVLYGNQCTWENFASVLSSPGISYAYMVTHGSSHVGLLSEVQRTNFYLTGSMVLSYYNDNLPERIKKRSDVHYMSSLGLGETDQLRIVHIDACRQTSYPDMADEWIDDVSIEDPSTDQLFISWGRAVVLPNDDWDTWSRDVWHWLGDGKNYQTAKQRAFVGNKSGGLIQSNIAEVGWMQVTFTSEGN